MFVIHNMFLIVCINNSGYNIKKTQLTNQKVIKINHTLRYVHFITNFIFYFI